VSAGALLTAGLFLVVTLGWLPASGPVDYYNVCVIRQDSLEAETICEQAYDGPQHQMAIPYEWESYIVTTQACDANGDVCGEVSEGLHLARATDINGDVNGDGAVGVNDYGLMRSEWGTQDTNRFTVCTPVETLVE
jgi:hypothetical protein